MGQRESHRRRRRGWLRLGLLLSAVWSGCHGSTLCCKEATPIPEGAIPPAAGTYMYAHRNMMANLAEADDFVVYEHEWADGGSTLNRYGEYHLQLIVKRLPTAPFPVVLQPHPSEMINQTRRMAVVRFLMTCGILDADARVIVDLPQAEGLDGVEAGMVTENALLGQFLSGTLGGNGYGNYGNGYGSNLLGGGFGSGFFRSGQYGGGNFGAGLRGYGGGIGGYRGGVGGFYPY